MSRLIIHSRPLALSGERINGWHRHCDIGAVPHVEHGALWSWFSPLGACENNST